MEKAVIPCSFKIFFSPSSTSLRPMYAIFFGSRTFGTHFNSGGHTWESNPMTKETGQPCKFPESVVKGVLISAWASIQRTPAFGYVDKVPATVPIAMEWSPPTVRAKVLASVAALTASKTDLVASPTMFGLLQLPWTSDSSFFKAS
ncbi:hypothetical protein WICPIJ_005054 [Wickerhamomyces pijperi]|uniref:Uncharacterized protein n=1 Tax=Wickerhamomyces pijperi TaxID=599730 RepID=A0A9P8Q6V6_WICPI|nr:hypothetical protein WICPIJ_005054 [Wickerhamomyces pijperi]